MTQTYKVQVSMSQAHIVESGLVWKQGDFGFNLEVEVLDFDTAGATPQIIFRKPSGAVEATEITRAGNKFTYAIRGTELDTPGPCICDIKLKDSTTKRISTASFKYFVVPDTMDGLNQQAGSYSDTIEQIVSGFDGEINRLDNAVAKRDEYRSEALNDAILHGNYTGLTALLSDGGLTGDVGETITITTTSSYKHTIIDAENINAVLVGVSSSTSSSYPYYVFACDINNKILARFVPRKSIAFYNKEIIIVPSDCKYLYIMTSSTIEVQKIQSVNNTDIKSVNILPPFVNDFGYFDTGSSKWQSSATSRASMFIPVTASEVLYYTSTITSWVGFFDENYTYLTRVKFEASEDVSLPSEIAVPNNTSIKYMLLTISLNHESVSNLMLTRIPSPQLFIPYSKYRIKEDTIYDKKLMIFGDSISHKQIRWLSTFLAFTQPDEYIDYAVNGAKWCDTRYNTTYPYQGNPSSSDSDNNVMGNQVQKAINEHVFDPDYIIIFVGTNDNYRFDDDTTVEQQFTDQEGDEIALDDVMRYTLAGSMRWCIENLKTEFPNAKIIIISPIQCAYGVRAIDIQKKRNARILEAAARLGCKAFDAWSESGIYAGFETTGAMGQYLVDGLHPYPPTGGKVLGTYIANTFLSTVALAK